MILVSRLGTGNRGFFRCRTIVHRAWSPVTVWRDEGTSVIVVSDAPPHQSPGVPITTVDMTSRLTGVKRWNFILRYSPPGAGDAARQLEAELMLGGAGIHVLDPVEREPDVDIGSGKMVPSYHVSGIAEVTSEELFRETLLRGVGKHRSSGFGLLLGAPA